MNPCFSFQEEMGAYLYESPPHEWEAHRSSCSECAQKFQSLQDIHKQISTLEIPVAPALIQEIKQNLTQELHWRKSLTFRRFPRFSWIAATLFFIFGFWVGIHYASKELSKFSSSSIETSSVSEETRSLPKNKFPTQNWISQEGLHFLKYGKNKKIE